MASTGCQVCRCLRGNGQHGCPEWKPVYFQSRDSQPNPYWIVNTGSNRRLRRSKHDIKRRFPVAVVGQTPSATNQNTVHLPESNIQHYMPPPVRHIDPPESNRAEQLVHRGKRQKSGTPTPLQEGKSDWPRRKTNTWVLMPAKITNMADRGLQKQSETMKRTEHSAGSQN